MADSKISALPASTTPLAGTEVLPVVQSSTTKQVSVANLTAGRVVSGSKFSPTGNDATGNGMYLPTTSQLAWSVNSTEYLRLTTTGLGIGTSTPGALLDISAAAGSNTQYFTGIDATGGGVTGAIGFRAAYTTGGTRYEHARIWANSKSGSIDVGSLSFGTRPSSGAITERVQIGSAGQFYILTDVTTSAAANVFIDTATTPAGQIKRSTSSLRYKTNVQDAVHGLAEVLQMRPVTYQGVNDGEKVFGGLIAEEIDAIGLTEFVMYDSEGRPDALHYGPMVALLAKAVQELSAKVDELTKT